MSLPRISLPVKRQLTDCSDLNNDKRYKRDTNSNDLLINIRKQDKEPIRNEEEEMNNIEMIERCRNRRLISLIMRNSEMAERELTLRSIEKLQRNQPEYMSIDH